MNPKDTLSKLKKHYDDLKPTSAPAGLFELADPVVDAILEACAYTISYQEKQIEQLRQELKALKVQVKRKGTSG